MTISVPYTQGFVQECNSQGLSNTQAAVLLELALEKSSSAAEVFVTSGNALWDAAFLEGLREEGFSTKQANVIMDYALQLQDEAEFTKAAAANALPPNPEEYTEWYAAWEADRKDFYGHSSLEKVALFRRNEEPDRINVQDKRTSSSDIKVGDNTYMTREEYGKRYGGGWATGKPRTAEQARQYRIDRDAFAERREREAQKQLDKGKYGITDSIGDMWRGVYRGGTLGGGWSDFKRGFKNILTGGWNTVKNTAKTIGKGFKKAWKWAFGGEEKKPQTNVERLLAGVEKDDPALMKRVKDEMKNDGVLTPKDIKNGPARVYDDPDKNGIVLKHVQNQPPQPQQQAPQQPTPQKPAPAPAQQSPTPAPAQQSPTPAPAQQSQAPAPSPGSQGYDQITTGTAYGVKQYTARDRATGKMVRIPAGKGIEINGQRFD